MFVPGPFTGVLVQPAAYTFIYRFMSNKSAEYPAGRLNGDVLNSFFAVSKDANGNLVHTPGHEVCSPRLHSTRKLIIIRQSQRTGTSVLSATSTASPTYKATQLLPPTSTPSSSVSEATRAQQTRLLALIHLTSVVACTMPRA